jgi:hypothetical protein
MLPGERFNNLYLMLEKTIIRISKKEEQLFKTIIYWNEIARVDFRTKDLLRFFYEDDYTDIKLIVTEVSFLNGDSDYSYFMGEEPELISWLLRPDIDRCVIELEKTIFLLS